MKFELIIPIIVFVVWVLNQLLRNREIDEPVRPKPGATPNRGPTSDIDKFLQEIDRLKRRGADERATVERPTAQLVPRAQPVVVQPERPRPVVRVRRERPSEMVPALTVAEPLRLPSASLAAPASQRAPQLDRRGDQRTSAAITTAMNLLRSPQTMAAAVVLQEVLGPPKSRRR